MCTRAWYRFLALTSPCLSRSDVFPPLWSCICVHTSVAQNVSRDLGGSPCRLAGCWIWKLQALPSYKHANKSSNKAQQSPPKLKQSAADRLLAVAYEDDLLSPVEAARKSA